MDIIKTMEMCENMPACEFCRYYNNVNEQCSFITPPEYWNFENLPDEDENN